MEYIEEIAKRAHDGNVYDIANFANASWRFWIGPTQDSYDIEFGLNRFANMF